MGLCFLFVCFVADAPGQKESLSPSFKLSLQVTLRLSSCSSLCFWTGVFLTWSLKFILVCSSREERKRERKKGKMIFLRSNEEIECFLVFLCLPSLTLPRPLSFSRSLSPFPTASERRQRGKREKAEMQEDHSDTQPPERVRSRRERERETKSDVFSPLTLFSFLLAR